MPRSARIPTLVSLSLVVGLAAGVAAPARAEARARTPGKNARGQDKSASPSAIAKDGSPGLKAEAAIILDLDSGEELYGKNADQVRAIASVGKLFLALAVRGKNLPLDGVTTIQEEDRKFASGGARSRLPVGKTFTNHDLLRAMLIQSDNRAVTAVARGAGMTPDQLVAAVNDKAKALGLTHTKFTDPTGLNGNVSTPREVLVALREVLSDQVLSDVLQTA